MKIFTVAVLLFTSARSFDIFPSTDDQSLNGTTVLRSLPLESGKTDNAFLAPKSPFSHPSADDPMDYASKRHLYTLAFFVETLTTGFGVHLIKSNVFDIPNDRGRSVAIIVSRMWSNLTLMNRITELLSAASTATAERYISLEDDSAAEKASIFQYHYNHTRKRILADPLLFDQYFKEREEVQKMDLSPLTPGVIDLRNMRTILRRMEVELLTNMDLRRMYLHLKFAYLAIGPVEKRGGNVYDNSLLAHAIVTLSTIWQVTDKVQSIYHEAITQALRMEAENPRSFGTHETMENALFSTLDRMFEFDLALSPALAVAERNLLSTT